MPKRGKNRGWTSDNDFPREPRREVYYHEHDDRTSGDHTRRVTFKPGNRITKSRRHHVDYDAPAPTRLLDEDVDMMQTAMMKGGRRYNPYSGGRSSRGRARRQGGRVNSPTPQPQQLVEVPSNWYKITIPHGGKYDKEYVLNLLLGQVAPDVFVPIGYRNQGQESTFFVDDYKTARRLLAADRKATTNDGFKLMVRARPGLPHMEITDAFKERMKLAMAKRYNAASKALDLERFHMDESLREDHVAALFRPTVMAAALAIAAANVPEMEALNLGDNRLFVVDVLEVLPRKFPNLAVLHLTNNKIRDIRQLDVVSGTEVTDLVLEGNPLTSKFGDKATYVR